MTEGDEDDVVDTVEGKAPGGKENVTIGETSPPRPEFFT